MSKKNKAIFPKIKKFHLQRKKNSYQKQLTEIILQNLVQK